MHNGEQRIAGIVLELYRLFESTWLAAQSHALNKQWAISCRRDINP
jgi:hypothetical protein